jgi:hypothetical protein
MHALLERVSLIFQRDDLSIGDVGAEVNSAIEEIAKLSTACGKLESQVHNFVTSRQGCWAENSFAITCDADDSDVLAHNADRLYSEREFFFALFGHVAFFIAIFEVAFASHPPRVPSASSRCTATVRREMSVAKAPLVTVGLDDALVSEQVGSTSC